MGIDFVDIVSDNIHEDMKTILRSFIGFIAVLYDRTYVTSRNDSQKLRQWWFCILLTVGQQRITVETVSRTVITRLPN